MEVNLKNPFDFGQLLNGGIESFFQSFFDQLIKLFATQLADIMGTAVDVLSMDFVVKGVMYSQVLALSILGIKVIMEVFENYILYQNGDSEADPTGVLVRTAQAVAVISSMPWIVKEVFIFGSKVTKDVAGLDSVSDGITKWDAIISVGKLLNPGTQVAFLFVLLMIVLGLLVVCVQSAIRGGELALMSVLGSFMALNLTANNRSTWSQWFKQLLVICTTQGLQIFMLKGLLSLLTDKFIQNNGLLFLVGWMWITIKTPQFVKQFAYSTGFTGSVGGGVKQAGSMALMRKMMAK